VHRNHLRPWPTYTASNSPPNREPPFLRGTERYSRLKRTIALSAGSSFAGPAVTRRSIQGAVIPHVRYRGGGVGVGRVCWRRSAPHPDHGLLMQLYRQYHTSINTSRNLPSARGHPTQDLAQWPKTRWSIAYPARIRIWFVDSIDFKALLRPF
jgi:hypothetical protein